MAKGVPVSGVNKGWFVKGVTSANKGIHSSLEDRLFHKINKTDTCWIWIGKVTNNYGSFGYSHNGVSRTKTAHRAVYELLVGEIPGGYQIDHLCRNKICVNPEHLEAVTPKENLMRADNAPSTINSRKTHCINGHEFTLSNTYQRKDRVARECRTCRNVSVRINLIKKERVAISLS